MKFYTKNDPKQDVHAVGIYFHGILQALAGYDVAYVQAPDNIVDLEEVKDLIGHYNLVEGISNTVVNIDGAYYPAIAYVWQTRYRLRGLVCLADDVESNAYAENMYNSKAGFL